MRGAPVKLMTGQPIQKPDQRRQGVLRAVRIGGMALNSGGGDPRHQGPTSADLDHVAQTFWTCRFSD